MTKFIYATDKYDPARESVVKNVIRIVSTIIELPKHIEVEFRPLAAHVYGETLLDARFKNRIRLHENLSPREVILPLVHELLHLNQSYLGKLQGRRDGSFLWDNKVYHVSKKPTIVEWANLPWEIDVAEKEQALYEKVINSHS